MAAQPNNQSAVGTDIANLFETISRFQNEINQIEERHAQERAALNDKHRTELAEKNDDFNRAKASFASYLKQAGIDTLLAPTTASKGKGKGKKNNTSDNTKDRKPRSSSDDVQKQLAIAQTVFTASNYQEKGLDKKTGWPVRHRGNSTKNEMLDAMMMDDAREAGYSIDIKNKTLTQIANAAKTRTSLTDTVKALDSQLQAKVGKKK